MERHGFATHVVGMIWGDFIGAAVMGSCLGLVTVMQIAKRLVKRP
jgi:hypothetical protein